MKESVVTIRRKDLDKFQGQSKGYTVWFNPDHELLKKFSLLKPEFYKNCYEKNIEDLDIKPYTMFLNRLILLS